MSETLPTLRPDPARPRIHPGSTAPGPRSAARRILLCAALGCAALPLLSAPAEAQAGTARRGERRGLVDQMVSMPRLGYLARLAKPIQVPVEGVSRSRLRDSFLEGRSGGRTHEAIDIHAPRGTPVVAVSDGTILRMRSGGLGGKHIFHLDEDGRTRYYYAHLDRWAEGLREGQRVKRGDTIGYVGDSGNAQPGDFHLHFSVALLRDARQWWRGSTPLNPYALLTGRDAAR